MRFLLDAMPTRVNALARGCIIPDIPDVAFIDLEYGSGTLAHAELSWLAPSKLRRTTIVGSRKMIVYDDTSIEPVRLFDSGVALRDPKTFGEYALSYRTGDILSPRVEVAEPIYRELEDFCLAILEDTTPRSSAKLGLDVVRMIEAVDASLASSGMPVEVVSEPALASERAIAPEPARTHEPARAPEPALTGSNGDHRNGAVNR
jgi:predicted dehydrogenase